MHITDPPACVTLFPNSEMKNDALNRGAEALNHVLGLSGKASTTCYLGKYVQEEKENDIIKKSEIPQAELQA